MINTDLIYPIGSIYLSVNSTNPSTLFGGVWEQIKDKFLLSSGDTYTNGATGGEATHTLTIDEMPSHKHSTTIGINDISEGYVITSGWGSQTYPGTHIAGGLSDTGYTGGGAIFNITKGSHIFKINAVTFETKTATIENYQPIYLSVFKISD